MKIAWHNCSLMDSADIVVFGVPSQKESLYKGTEQGPNEIRAASIKWLSGETLQGKRFVLQPQGGPIKKNVFDAYNIEKKEVPYFVERLASRKKIPAMLGGDHSNTLGVLEGLASVHKSFSLVCFDAHLDMVSREGMFYGSVFHQAFSIKQLRMGKSACVGCRAFRDVELKNARKQKLLVIPAIEVERLGVKKVFQKIKKRVSKKVYLSIDIDCADPSNAPGVSDPVAGGLTSNQLISLSKMVASNKIIGFDLVEVNPARDQFNLTVNLGAKIIGEVIASIG